MKIPRLLPLKVGDKWPEQNCIVIDGNHLAVVTDGIVAIVSRSTKK